jgi:hypothetical protein
MMGYMREVFDDMMRHNRERKIKNLASADHMGWTIHNKHHWSRDLNGKRLDFWPREERFQYDGRDLLEDKEGI